MTTINAATPPLPMPVRERERWLARRRWARAGWLYLFMLVMSVFFLGPFLMGVLSSVKEDPNEYPPRLIVAQLTPRYISRSYQLGMQGSNDGWQGGLVPGGKVDFEVLKQLLGEGLPILKDGQARAEGGGLRPERVERAVP